MRQLGIYSYSRLCAVGVECGFSADAVIRQAGLHIDLARKPDSPLTLGDLEPLYREALAATSKGHFPLAVAKRFSFDFFPEVEAFLATSPNVLSAARVVEWLPDLLFPELLFDIELEEDKVNFTVSLSGYRDCPEHHGILESMTAGGLYFLKKLTGAEAPCTISLAHKPMADPAIYAAYLGLEPQFNTQAHGMSLARTCAEQAIAPDSSDTHAQTVLAIERVIEGLGEKRRFSQSVRRALLHTLQGSAEAVAKHMNLPLRTLQRRLHDEGTSFQQVQDEVMRERAQHHLKDPNLDIDSIAIKLGFSDRHSFSRAFKRWTGSTPAAWRQNYLAENSTHPYRF